MREKLIDMYVSVFGRPIFAKYHKFLLLIALRGLGVLNWKAEKQSGEVDFALTVLPQIDKDGLAILDVGANEGDFIGAVIKKSHRLKVLGIEPHPKTFRRLAERFQSESDRVSLFNIGAANADTLMSLYDHSGKEGTGHASLLKNVIEEIHQDISSSCDVPVRRLDNLIADSGVTIAMIKIDVEGYEIEVLRGLEKTIKCATTKYLIIEFNEMNVTSGVFMKQLIDLLSEYNPYRILPSGRLLALFPYIAVYVEQFAYQNIVFVRK